MSTERVRRAVEVKVEDVIVRCDVCGRELSERDGQCELCGRDAHHNGECSKYDDDHGEEGWFCKTCWDLGAEFRENHERLTEEIDDAYEKWVEACQDHAYDGR